MASTTSQDIMDVTTAERPQQSLTKKERKQMKKKQKERIRQKTNEEAKQKEQIRKKTNEKAKHKEKVQQQIEAEDKERREEQLREQAEERKRRAPGGRLRYGTNSVSFPGSSSLYTSRLLILTELHTRPWQSLTSTAQLLSPSRLSPHRASRAHSFWLRS